MFQMTRLLASSDVVVQRKELRKANLAASKAPPEKAAFKLTNCLLTLMYTVNTLGNSCGQGIRKKKEGDTRPPLEAHHLEVLRGN